MRTIATALSLFSCAIALSACQPQGNTVAQQQHFICSALIEGFLKAQNLTQYQLWHIQPALQHVASQRLYVYQAQTSYQPRLMPSQKKLRFNCEQNSAQQFQIKLAPSAEANGAVPEETLLSLQLPQPERMKQLTVYTLGSPERKF